MNMKIKIDFIDASEKQTGEFCELYRRVIPNHEQVDPAQIVRSLSRPNRAPRSIDELANRTQWSGQKSYQLLLGAWADSKMVGFANLVFVPSMRLAFVGQLAGLPVAGQPGAVTQEIFAHIDSLSSMIPWEWLVFELANDGVEIRRALARQRLFRRYLRGLNRETFRIAVPYRLPSQATADLMIAAIGPNRRAPGTLAKASVLNLVRSIYFDIYADALAPNVNSYLYCSGLEAQLRILERKLPEQVALHGEFKVSKLRKNNAPISIARFARPERLAYAY
ncbi:MAG: hypothetical protein HY074_02895 [Deltaproteobacteria bacterium]|nr:hypothetical protein [Deltaproteobacteria bacterium]